MSALGQAASAACVKAISSGWKDAVCWQCGYRQHAPTCPTLNPPPVEDQWQTKLRMRLAKAASLVRLDVRCHVHEDTLLNGYQLSLRGREWWCAYILSRLELVHARHVDDAIDRAIIELIKSYKQHERGLGAA